MRVTAVKTRIVEAGSIDITELLVESLKGVPERSVIAITSKVVSLCEGNALPVSDYNKDDLIEKEADLFIPRSDSKYSVYLTIKNNMLVPTAGIDESNTNGYYVLWPKDPQESANRCWEFVRKHFGIKHVGIIITDSTSNPMRLGVTGRSIASCGFSPVTFKIGHTDLFGRPLGQTRINVADALAASAVLVMGESDEQTPVALIEDLPFAEFSDHVPTAEQLAAWSVEMEDDLYAHFLTRMDWKKKKD
jgi:putative folate metabolism gamma-glutamate ligase